MPFKPGHKKLGGRQKGVANKETQDLHAICAKHGVDVFESMLIIIAKEKDDHARFDMCERVSKYLYPVRKAIEHSSDEKGFKIIIEDYRNKEDK